MSRSSRCPGLPVTVTLHVGALDRDGQIQRARRLQLVGEDGREARRPASEGHDSRRHSGRLRPHRGGDGTAGLGHQHAASRSRAGRRAVRTRRRARAPRRDGCRDAAKSSISHRAASALSVNPISTCFASLVTLASASPASRAAADAISTTSVSPARPASSRRAVTASTRAPMCAFGGSDHSGRGMRSIFRRLSRRDTISAVSPCRGQLTDGRLGGGVQGRVLGRGRLAAFDEMRSGLVHLVHLGATVQREHQAAGRRRTGAELAVDIPDVGSAHHRDLQPGRAERLDELAHPLGVAATVGDGGAVPVEHDRLEAPIEQSHRLGHAQTRPGRGRRLRGDRAGADLVGDGPGRSAGSVGLTKPIE